MARAEKREPRQSKRPVSGNAWRCLEAGRFALPRRQTPPGVTGVEAPSMWIRQTTNFGCGNVVSGVWLAGRAHAKLAAGGVDVLASRVSNRGGDSGAFEDLYESGDRSPRRRFV